MGRSSGIDVGIGGSKRLRDKQAIKAVPASSRQSLPTRVENRKSHPLSVSMTTTPDLTHILAARGYGHSSEQVKDNVCIDNKSPTEYIT